MVQLSAQCGALSVGTHALCELLIPISSNCREAIAIPVFIPELHHIHSHLHEIPVGKFGNGNCHSPCRLLMLTYVTINPFGRITLAQRRNNVAKMINIESTFTRCRQR